MELRVSPSCLELSCWGKPDNCLGMLHVSQLELEFCYSFFLGTRLLEFCGSFFLAPACLSSGAGMEIPQRLAPTSEVFFGGFMSNYGWVSCL